MVHFGEFLKSEVCGQTVLPDRSLLIEQKLVENAKIQMSNFQTMCDWVLKKRSWKCHEWRKNTEATRWEMKITIFPRVFGLVRKCPVQCPFDEMLMPGHDGLVVCRPKTILRIGDPKCRWKNGNIHRVRLFLDDTFVALHNRNLVDNVPCLSRHV